MRPSRRTSTVGSLVLAALVALPCAALAEEAPPPTALRARIVPAFEDGRAAGFKLFSIQPGSRLEALGLKNGDTIEQVDGTPVRTPEDMLALLRRIEAGETPRLTLRQVEPENTTPQR